MKVFLILIYILILCFFIGGCQDFVNQQGASIDDTDGFQVTTYNAGLLPNFVPLTAERVGLNASLLKEHDADVVCVQEVWLDEHVESIRSAVIDTYPHIYHEAARQKLASTAPTCSTAAIANVSSCVLSQCAPSGISFQECLANQCLAAHQAMAASNTECATAAFAQASTSISDALSTLQNTSTPAGLFAFGGSNGLMLLSKHELQDVQVLDFFNESTVSHRVVIFATVEVEETTHHIGCAHLTSNFGNAPPYTGSLGSWEAESLFEAQAMISFAENYADGGPQYLAGDFNCSLEKTAHSVEADFGNTCQAFLDAGYQDPAMEQLECSYCPDNFLNVLKSFYLGVSGRYLLDHIFTKDLPNDGLLKTQFVLNEEEVVTSNGIDIPVHPSDHYGIRLTVPQVSVLKP